MDVVLSGSGSDTIFANAAGMGGAIGIIRVSGPDAVDIVDKIFV